MMKVNILTPQWRLEAVSIWLMRSTRLILGYAIAIVPSIGGFALGIAGFQWWGGIRLLGGLAPGWLVATLVAIVVSILFLRHAPLRRAIQRRRGAGSTSILVAAVLFPLRGALIGALIAVVAVRTFNPVRATHVYASVHVADHVNDASYAAELMTECGRILASHPHANVEFGTSELKHLVEEVQAGRIQASDARCWTELKRQQPINDRLADLRKRLTDRIGETVYVVSVERPTNKVQPWPVWPERIHSRWISVDPASTPRSDRTQLVSYCFCQDAAAAPFFYATLAVKAGDPTPSMVVEIENGTPLRVESSGHFGQHWAYRLTVPRERKVKAVRFESHGKPIAIDALTDLKLASRQLKVKVPTELSALMALPTFADQVSGPIRFVSSGADVEWGTGPTSGLAGPFVEFLSGPTTFEAASPTYRLARTPAGVASALGSIALPKAGSEFRDLSPGALVDPPGKRLIDLAREPDAPSPFVFQRSASVADRVTVIIPRTSDLPKLEGNVPQALGKLIVWATSLAWRGGKLSHPALVWQLEPSVADSSLSDAGPPEFERTVWRQLVDGFSGHLDSNLRLNPGNNVRATCDAYAWAIVGCLLLLSMGAAVTAQATCLMTRV